MKLIKLIWKVLKLPFIVLGLILSLFSTSQAEVKKPKTFKEVNYIEELWKHHNFEKGKHIGQRFQPDLFFEGYVVEVDWEHKMYEALGQSLVYSYVSGKKPGIVILDDINRNTNYEKFLDIFDHYEIKIWIAEVDKKSKEILNLTERHTNANYRIKR